MIKKTLPLLLLLCSLGIEAQHKFIKAPAKVDAKLFLDKVLTEQNTAKAPSLFASSAQLEAIVTCHNNSAIIAKKIQALGYYAQVIDDNTLVAKFATKDLEQISKLPGIKKIDKARQHRPLMDQVLRLTGANKVQQGYQLETPFDGSGVIIGIIDQGFDYTHPAFKNPDGTSRIKMLWNRQDTLKNKQPIYDGKEILKRKHDSFHSHHATHVANIAGGSRIKKADGKDSIYYYGIAPKADLAFFPSTFSESEVITSIQALKNYAAKEGKPWVVNMSFGSQIGPHDGTTNYDQTLSKLLSEKGGLACAAMGNEGGQKLHFSHTFTSNQDTIYTLLEESKDFEQVAMIVDIWADSLNANDFNIDFFVYDTLKKEVLDQYPESFYYTYDNKYDNDNAIVFYEDSTNNGKINFELVYMVNHFRNAKLPKTQTKITRGRYVLGVKFYGPANYTFHAWINANQGEWIASNRPNFFKQGDDKFLVSEGAASAEKVVAVAAYVSSPNFTSWKDKQNYGTGEIANTIASFSSQGPQLDNKRPKPAITAPGTFINSAFNRYEYPLSDNYYGITVTKVLSNDTDTAFYGASQGTSQASPVVTGAIALWLQANPTLTYEDVIEILKTSSKKDAHTGKEEWNSVWGYGKINIYEGLKKALQLKKNTITNLLQTHNSELPLTLLTEGKVWKLLFNNSEDFATIQVFSLDGQKVLSKNLNHIYVGQEEVLNLQNFEQGVYLLRVKTAKSNYTRKVIL